MSGELEYHSSCSICNSDGGRVNELVKAIIELAEMAEHQRLHLTELLEEELLECIDKINRTSSQKQNVARCARS